VGTIGGRWLCSGMNTVHPHGRGDNLPPGLCMTQSVGSPPRAWGQYHPQRLRIPRVRFTPTGVGTIGNGSGAVWLYSVHPHGRGDNNANDAANVQPIGSPPRAWGQLPVHSMT